MKTPNTTASLNAIESKYGAYVSKDDRKDVGAFLFRRFADDDKCLRNVVNAIKEYHETRFGPPDVATVRKAIDAYEAAYDTRIIKEHVPVVIAPSESEIEETRINCKRLAEEKGINTNNPEWASQYFFMVMAEQKAKESKD